MRNITGVLFYWVILLGPANIYGQKRFLSIGPELAFPGYYDQSYNSRGTGIGGSFRFESAWAKHTAGMVTIGYLSFAEANPFGTNSTYSTTTKVNAIPIQLGMKYYTQPHEISKGFFVSTEVGAMPTTTHITYTNGTTQKVSEFCIAGALGLGYMYRNIELSSRLQWNFSNTGWHIYYYNFRLAYAFIKWKVIKP